MAALLLDNCAIIFIAEGKTIDQTARQQIKQASLDNGVFVSPISAWEIGLLATKRAIAFLPDPKAWFRLFLAYPGVRLTPLTPEIAIDSSFLPRPQQLHADPADRLLIATARALDVPIVTRDRRILSYGQTGLLKIIPC
jgi:PIN domain nuclease of toxin-antitoxin system